MSQKFVEDHFVLHVLKGIEAGPSLQFAIADVSTEITQKITKGSSIEDALSEFGIQTGIAERIRSELNLSREPPNTATVLAIRVVVGGGGVAGIPTAACIDAHLPKGRRRTAEELRKAYEACRQK